MDITRLRLTLTLRMLYGWEKQPHARFCKTFGTILQCYQEPTEAYEFQMQKNREFHALTEYGVKGRVSLAEARKRFVKGALSGWMLSAFSQFLFFAAGFVLTGLLNDWIGIVGTGVLFCVLVITGLGLLRWSFTLLILNAQIHPSR